MTLVSLPMDDSAIYLSSEIRNVEKRAQVYGDTTDQLVLNKLYQLKIPINPEIRLKHGLFLTVDLQNRQLLLKTKNLEDMKNSGDVQVKAFYRTHKDHLENLAEPDGAVVATYYPVIPAPTVTSLPCRCKFIKNLTLTLSVWTRVFKRL